VVLPGSVFGDGYIGLQSNARCYIHATEVGGTHPALIEAMGAGNLCLVLDTPENREVAGPDAWYFADESELAELLSAVDQLSADRLSRNRARIRARVADRYSWSRVATSYRDLIFGAPG
jgi:glycosyltransferase involved in cell wall biosynthesis